MSSLKTVKLILEGNVPSKKNSRINTRSGRSFPNKRFIDWQESAIWQVRQQTRERFFGQVRVEAIIYFGTKGRSDADNRLTSILDMLVDMVFLPYDAYQCVVDSRVIGLYRKGNPGAFVRVSETTTDEVSKAVDLIIHQ